MIRTVLFVSGSELDEIVPRRFDVLFSITSPGQVAEVQGGWLDVYRTSFVDAEYDAESLKTNGIAWWIASGAISPVQAEAMKKTLDVLARSPLPINLVVHGLTGITLSVAVAEYVVERYHARPRKQFRFSGNKTVRALLHDPWCLCCKSEYESKMVPAWKRLANSAAAKLLDRKSSIGGQKSKWSDGIVQIVPKIS